MNRSVLNRTLLNTSVLCQSRLNQSGLASLCGKAGGIPAAIRSAMVLWYDIARQGCSNETMQENPVLRDLSGNGHDAICYNFGWSGMSGVGGYGIINLSNWIFNFPENVTIINVNKLKIYGNVTQIIRCTINKSTTFKLSVKGATQDNPLYIRFIQNELLNITQDGIYDVELNYEDGVLNLVEFGCQEEITIEQLPLYPGALVSDGVDDYAYVEGLPILTKEEGYTVVAKRRLFENIGITLAKTNGSVLSEGAFSFENNLQAVNFGNSTSITPNTGQDEIVWQTSKSYNGKDINIGDKTDSDFMYIAYSGSSSQQYKKLAFYSLALFDRDLTAEEIEWVKTNLITA